MRLFLILFVFLHVSIANAGLTPFYNCPTPDQGSINWSNTMNNYFNCVDNQVHTNETTFDSHINANDYPHLDPTAPSDLSGTVTLNSSVTAGADGGSYVTITASWTASGAPDLSYYSIRIKESSSNYVYYQTTETSFQFPDGSIIPGATYIVNIRAIDRDDNMSNWTIEGSSPNGTIIAAADTSPPSNPASLTVTGGFGFFVLKWINPTDADFRGMEVWRSDTNNRASAIKIVEAKSDWYHDGTFPAQTTKYYWIRAIDTGGNFSGYYPTSSTAGGTSTTVYLNAAQDIEDATIDIASKVSGLLPNANLSQITDPGILANNIVDSTKIANGSINRAELIVGRIIAADNIVANIITANELAANSITASEVGANEIIANTLNIKAGLITNAHIGNLSADKITAGTISADRIGANSITATHIGANEIVTDTANIKDGTIIDADIDFLTADVITAGTLSLTSGGVALSVENSGQMIFKEDVDIRFIKNSDPSNYFHIRKSSGSPDLIFEPSINDNHNMNFGVQTAGGGNQLNYLRATTANGFWIFTQGTTSYLYKFTPTIAAMDYDNDGSPEFLGSSFYGFRIRDKLTVDADGTGGNEMTISSTEAAIDVPFVVDQDKNLSNELSVSSTGVEVKSDLKVKNLNGDAALDIDTVKAKFYKPVQFPLRTTTTRPACDATNVGIIVYTTVDDGRLAYCRFTSGSVYEWRTIQDRAVW